MPVATRISPEPAAGRRDSRLRWIQNSDTARALETDGWPRRGFARPGCVAKRGFDDEAIRWSQLHDLPARPHRVQNSDAARPLWVTCPRTDKTAEDTNPMRQCATEAERSKREWRKGIGDRNGFSDAALAFRMADFFETTKIITGLNRKTLCCRPLRRLPENKT